MASIVVRASICAKLRLGVQVDRLKISSGHEQSIVQGDPIAAKMETRQAINCALIVETVHSTN